MRYVFVRDLFHVLILVFYQHAAQQHELTLTRHYEELLLSRETTLLSTELASTTNLSVSLSRISHLLRLALRANGGEIVDDDAAADPSSPLYHQAEDEDAGGYYQEGLSREDWALERECEIVRLEKENEELRRLLGLVQDDPHLNQTRVSPTAERQSLMGSSSERSSLMGGSSFRARVVRRAGRGRGMGMYRNVGL